MAAGFASGLAAGSVAASAAAAGAASAVSVAAAGSAALFFAGRFELSLRPPFAGRRAGAPALRSSRSRFFSRFSRR